MLQVTHILQFLLPCPWQALLRDHCTECLVWVHDFRILLWEKYLRRVIKGKFGDGGSNYSITALISHTTKVMLKILQARLQ